MEGKALYHAYEAIICLIKKITMNDPGWPLGWPFFPCFLGNNELK